MKKCWWNKICKKKSVNVKSN